MTHGRSAERFRWHQVAFLADAFHPDASALPPEARTDLEKSGSGTVLEVSTAVRNLGLTPIVIETPAALIKQAAALAGAVVLSTYGGDGSRNRLLIPPAIAEVLGLDYVGMDAVGHALAANKAEAKNLARECGIPTPRFRVIREPQTLGICEEFPTPYVLKPLAEGSSIGISQRNLVRDGRTGREVAAALLARFGQPVLIEAFVGGSEASLVCIEAAGRAHAAFVEVHVANDPDYFDAHLFDAGEKLNRSLDRRVRLVREDMHPTDREGIERLLRAVGHYGYCRVDGKFHRGRFHFLEITPDPWLGSSGQLAAGFVATGWSYEEVIAAILRSAALRPPGRPAND